MSLEHASEPLRRRESQRGSRWAFRRRFLPSATATGGADRQRSLQTPILASAAGTVGILETGVRAGPEGGWWSPQHASDVGVKKVMTSALGAGSRRRLGTSEMYVYIYIYISCGRSLPVIHSSVPASRSTMGVRVAPGDRESCCRNSIQLPADTAH